MFSPKAVGGQFFNSQYNIASSQQQQQQLQLQLQIQQQQQQQQQQERGLVCVQPANGRREFSSNFIRPLPMPNNFAAAAAGVLPPVQDYGAFWWERGAVTERHGLRAQSVYNNSTAIVERDTHTDESVYYSQRHDSNGFASFNGHSQRSCENNCHGVFASFNALPHGNLQSLQGLQNLHVSRDLQNCVTNLNMPGVPNNSQNPNIPSITSNCQDSFSSSQAAFASQVPTGPSSQYVPYQQQQNYNQYQDHNQQQHYYYHSEQQGERGIRKRK